MDGQYRDPQTGEVVDPMIAAILIAGAGVLDYARAHRIVPPALRKLLAHRDPMGPCRGALGAPM